MTHAGEQDLKRFTTGAFQGEDSGWLSKTRSSRKMRMNIIRPPDSEMKSRDKLHSEAVTFYLCHCVLQTVAMSSA